MKKIALFVSVLLLTGSLFAADPVFEAKPGISGDATMTFGIALDTTPTIATGITNATSTNITLGLINKDSNEKGGKDGEEVYGWIKLKDFELKIDGELKIGKPGIEAKLFLGPVYINILGVENKVSKAAVIKAAVVSAKTVDAANALKGEHQGLAIGLKDTSIVDVTIGVNSLYDWSDGNKAGTFKWAFGATAPTAAAQVGAVTSVADAAAVTDKGANTDNVYQFYLAVGLKAVPNLTFDVAANFASPVVAGVTGAVDLGAGAKAAYKVAIAENISIEPYAAFDLEMASGTVAATSVSAMLWQLDAGATLGLPGAKKKITFAKEIEHSPGLTAQFTMSGASATVGTASATADGSTDLGVYFFDGDLIPVANVLVAFEMTDLSNLAAIAGETGFGVWANADLGQILPWAQFSYAQAAGATAASLIKLEIGAEIKVITNTTFTLKYSNDGLALATPTKGTITFATKIAY